MPIVPTPITAPAAASDITIHRPAPFEKWLALNSASLTPMAGADRHYVGRHRGQHADEAAALTVGAQHG